MRQDPLVKAIVAALMLLEDSGDDEINPDTAVRGMENIAHELLVLTDDERAEFINLVEEVASAETDERYAAFTRRVPQMIGMVDF
jgi:hypothetical protein